MDLKRIVVATDFSEASLIAVETGFNLMLESGANLYLLHVMEFPVVTDPVMGVIGPPIEEMYQEEMEQLENLVPQNLKGVKVEAVVLEGSPAKAVADFAREKAADLIVVGTHGRTGLTRVLMGSTAEHLLRQAPCQVLVVKQKTSRAVS